MRVDAHQHFWNYNPVRDTWITPDMRVLRRDYLPGDLEPILACHRFDGCVAIQADQSDAETQFLLRLCGVGRLRRGAVRYGCDGDRCAVSRRCIEHAARRGKPAIPCRRCGPAVVEDQ